MATFILRRILILIPLLWVISVISFTIIQLPSGDYLTSYVQRLKASGKEIDEAEIARLTGLYGLDQPVTVQYFRWIGNIITEGDLGFSFQWNAPVREVIGERILLTMIISLVTILFSWAVSIPIGIYSATHQYSPFDYFWTFIGFIGLATPGFLIALVVVWLLFSKFNIAITGLFSSKFAEAAWSIPKVLNMLSHIWVPMVILGLAGTAGLIRVLRATLLDELNKQYVVTARAKGLPEGRLLFKYPVRVAINPLVSTIGWMLPAIISGEALVAIVMNIPTTGPILLRALMFQDMYLAGSFVLILSTLTVIGTLISDILLAFLDPRIRFKGASQ
jgi:peptide/nickel transport system permease protein